MLSRRSPSALPLFSKAGVVVAGAGAEQVGALRDDVRGGGGVGALGDQGAGLEKFSIDVEVRRVLEFSVEPNGRNSDPWLL